MSETPITDKLEAMKKRAKAARTSPKAHDSWVAKGQLQVIDAILDDVFSAEDSYNTLTAAQRREERHSGFGRGDSMG